MKRLSIISFFALSACGTNDSVLPGNPTVETENNCASGLCNNVPVPNYLHQSTSPDIITPDAASTNDAALTDDVTTVGDACDPVTGLCSIDTDAMAIVDAMTDVVLIDNDAGSIADDGGSISSDSGGSSSDASSVCVIPKQSCVYTQGFWVNHSCVWLCRSLTFATAPFSSFYASMTFDEATLLSVLGAQISSNAVIILGQQLIAAMLNGGQNDPVISDTVQEATTMLLGVMVGSGNGWNSFVAASSAQGQTMIDLSTTLDNYNSGNLGTPHCQS